MALAGDFLVASDWGDLSDDSSQKPLVSLIQGAAQSIPNNAFTAITYAGTDVIDTHNYHNPAVNNTRVTPLKAGYYRVMVTYWTAASVPLTFIETVVRLNGVTNVGAVSRTAGLGGAASNTGPAIGGAQSFSVSTSAIVSVNGSTDYVEHVVRQTQSSGVLAVNTNSTGNAFSCSMDVEFLRDL